MKIYDVIIIGLGCAGAGAFLQARKSTESIMAIEEKRIGGRIRWADNVTNMPLVKSISGKECARAFEKQLTERAEIKYEKCICIRERNGCVEIETDKGFHAGKFAVVCTGREPKNFKKTKLELKTIHDKTAGRNVCIIGGGEVSVDYAISLKKRQINAEVVSRGGFEKINKELLENAKRMKIKLNGNCSVKSIEKDRGFIVKFTKNNKSFSKRFTDVISCIGTKKSIPQIIRTGSKSKRVLYAGTLKDSMRVQCAIAFADGVRAGMEVTDKLRNEK